MQEKATGGGFFLLPNEIFTLGLSAGEIAMYTYLLFCKDRETYLCYPSFRKIGKCTGMSPNTVRKYITQLEDKRLVGTPPTTVWPFIGRDCEKRDAALHDLAHPRSSELPPGTPDGRIATEETYQEKAVKSKLGPVRPCVRFWGQGRETTPAGRVPGPVGGV